MLHYSPVYKSKQSRPDEFMAPSSITNIASQMSKALVGLWNWSRGLRAESHKTEPEPETPRGLWGYYVMAWMSNESNQSNVWQVWRGGWSLKRVGKPIFVGGISCGDAELANVWTPTSHVRENEMCPLTTVSLKKRDCQIRRDIPTMCLWFDKALIVITV